MPYWMINIIDIWGKRQVQLTMGVYKLLFHYNNIRPNEKKIPKMSDLIFKSTDSKLLTASRKPGVKPPQLNQRQTTVIWF